MITANVSEEAFRDDAGALLKSFYPTETVVTVKSPPPPGDVLGLQVIWEDPAEPRLTLEINNISSYSKIELRNLYKKQLYRLLSKKTGRELPWGALTGVRPTRLAWRQLAKGARPTEAAQFLQREYFVSREKAELAVRIAGRERRILQAFPFGEGYSVYIGIPFCPSRCLYCSFSSYPIEKTEALEKPYLQALFREIAFASEIFPQKTLHTVYVGGGTPTALSPGGLQALLDYVNQQFSADHCPEFTVEAGRPDSIDREKLRILKDHGVSRICVNPQTMNDETLRRIGRAHSADEVKKAFFLAREEGFSNINMDLILGLPGEGEREVEHTVGEIVQLEPDDLTVHSLALKRASRLAEQVEEYRKKGMVNTEAMMKIAAGGAQEIGLTPYYLYRQKNIAGNFENTGYAREAGDAEDPGKMENRGTEGLYNILMMEEEEPIIACGAGTVSKMVRPDPANPDGKRITRCDTLKGIEAYIGQIDEMIERKQKLFGSLEAG